MEIPNTYLFIATFADGSQIFQNQTDAGAVEGRNCFFDVLSRDEQPVSFVITDGKQVFGVDLRDGHFECNGVPFFQHRPEFDAYRDFKLVYFRTPRIEIDRNSNEITRGMIAGYTIGWEVQYKGERVERTFNVYFE